MASTKGIVAKNGLVYELESLPWPVPKHGNRNGKISILYQIKNAPLDLPSALFFLVLLVATLYSVITLWFLTAMLWAVATISNPAPILNPIVVPNTLLANTKSSTIINRLSKLPFYLILLYYLLNRLSYSSDSIYVQVLKINWSCHI